MPAEKKILKGAKARYELITLLAMGGMAEIWLARQQGSREMGKLVVVKRILPYLASQKKFMEMFIDEARITSRCSSSWSTWRERAWGSWSTRAS